MTRAILISRDTLVREGMKALVDSQFEIRHMLDSMEKAVEVADAETALVFVDLRLDDEAVEPLKALRHAYPQSRIVAYADRIELPSKTLFEVFGTLNGCLMSDASLDVLRQSLALIMMGEPVFPLAALLPIYTHGDDELHTRQFSDRERQILRYLSEGRRNKFIGRQLGLSEATVKVHVKTVLRKIGCSNRTQAALWATRHKPGASW